MLEIFVKGPRYSTFISAKYEYSTQSNFFVKSTFVGKCGLQPVTPVDTVKLYA